MEKAWTFDETRVTATGKNVKVRSTVALRKEGDNILSFKGAIVDLSRPDGSVEIDVYGDGVEVEVLDTDNNPLPQRGQTIRMTGSNSKCAQVSGSGNVVNIL